MIYKKTFQFVSLFFLFATNTDAHTKSIFKEIAPLLVASEITPALEVADYKINLNAPQYKSVQKKEEAPKTNLNLMPLTKNEIMQTYLALFQEFDTHATLIQDTKICTLKELKKLNVLSGTESSAHTSLRGIIPTQTAAGEIVKTAFLATPTHNISTLKQRQKKIQYLYANPDLLRQIQEQLDVIAQNEALFLNYFKVLDEIEQNALNEFYFHIKGVKELNNSRGGLNTFYLVSRTSTLLGFVPFQIWQQLALHTGKEFEIQAGSFLQKIAHVLKHLPQILTNGTTAGTIDFVQQHNPATNALIRNEHGNSFSISPTGKTHASWGDIALKIEHELTHGTYSPSTYKKYGTRALGHFLGAMNTLNADIVTGQLVYKTIQQHKKFVSILRNFHTKLHAASEIAGAYQKLYELTQDTPLHCDKLEHLMNTSPIKKRGTLKKLLKSTTIKKRFNLLSEWGEILATNHQVEEEKTALTNPLFQIAELDLFAAAAESMLAANMHKKPASLTIFADGSQQPFFVTQSFWNPLVQHNKAVTNSVALDPQNSRNMLFTGPNGSGKSTNTKALLFNIILGQTLGIAFAESFTLTPYTKIMTAHEEHEDVAQSMSSFMAEKQRIDSICQLISAAGQNDRILLFMDEPIKGTVEEAAGKIILEACQKIAEQPQVNAMVITHTEAPLAAEKLTDGQFKNYFVEVVQETGDANFTRTFKLKQGAADWWFANPTTRKSFIDFLSKTEDVKSVPTA